LPSVGNICDDDDDDDDDDKEEEEEEDSLLFSQYLQARVCC
jgi:hypothetical protein